ncbi:pilus assembly protein [Telmatobacter sp. DSM 110680]|uniref:Pilus assembly protein n=1 Tax=Telmatobacter sp. DSM 110680 TaxID=3036704 RepID=A0AAU7DHG8_9BACT
MTKMTQPSRRQRWLQLKTGSLSKISSDCRVLPCEEGSNIVEMAVVSSVLLAVLFGIVELSLAMYTYNYVSDAAREGTRYAMVRGSSCSVLTNCGVTSAQIQTYVQSLGYPGMNAANTTVTTTWLSPSTTTPVTWTVCGSTCNAPGDAVQVKVTYSFKLSIPFVPNSTLNLHSTSLMVIAN